MNEAISYISKNRQHAKMHIDDCIMALKAIRDTLVNSAPEYNVNILDNAMDTFYQLNEFHESSDFNKLLKQCKKDIYNIKSSVLSQVKVRWKALFLPYKASMWTSLESIWKAADSDPNCDATVVVIPYYELDSAGNRKNFCYEKDKFPEYVPVTHYEDYNIATEEPEMIFFHNPYDDQNTLTSVPEIYYTRNLKPYAEQLVYSPYFTYSIYNPGKSDFQYAAVGMYNADKIIAQSKRVKQIFQYYKHPAAKIMAVGSPKTDAIVNSMKVPVSIPKEWEDKIKGKKVFLLNTHLSYFPTAYQKAGDNNYAVKWHKRILKAIVNRQGSALIWRPHPLLKTMLETRFPQCLDFVHEMEQIINESDNCVIDTNSDYSIAFRCSDALISTYSTLINEYMVTGKPVLIIQTKISDEIAIRSPIDYRLNYYTIGSEKISVEKFVEMVLNGDDPLYEKRMKMINRAFLNLDGTVGEKVYRQVCNDILKRS